MKGSEKLKIFQKKLLEGLNNKTAVITHPCFVHNVFERDCCECCDFETDKDCAIHTAGWFKR
jgi:hypothetical protein